MSNYGRCAVALVAAGAVAMVSGALTAQAQEGGYVTPVGPGSYAPPPQEQYAPAARGDWPPSSWEPAGGASSRWAPPPGPYRSVPGEEAERAGPRSEYGRPAWAQQPPAPPYPPASAAQERAGATDPGYGWAPPTGATTMQQGWGTRPAEQWQRPVPPPAQAWGAEPPRGPAREQAPPQPPVAGGFPPPGYGQGTPPTPPAAQTAEPVPADEQREASGYGMPHGAPPGGPGYGAQPPVAQPQYGYGAPPAQYGAPWGWGGYPPPPPQYRHYGYGPYGPMPGGRAYPPSAGQP